MLSFFVSRPSPVLATAVECDRSPVWPLAITARALVLC